MCNSCIEWSGKKWHKDDQGYYASGSKRLHRAVWESVHGETSEFLDIHHVNEDKSDNRIENLALYTRPEHRAIHKKLTRRDNSSIDQKVKLRLSLLREVQNPVVLDAYAGTGMIWQQCYSRIPDGIAIEKNPEKADILADQRPTWAVYETDNVAALRSGVGNHLRINFVDFDAYGAPWDAIDAFFESERPWPDVLAVVVTDGLRHKLKAQGGFNVKQLASAVQKYGNEAMHEHYLTICREMLEEKTGRIGYAITRVAGYYCGHSNVMTHYAAVLTRA